MARITTTAIAVCLALSGCGHPADEWTSPPDTGRTVPVTNDFEPAAPLDEPGVVPAVNIEPPTGETDDDNDIDSDATDNIVDGDTPEAATCPLEGAVFHVDATAEGGDGTSWDRAMVRLQDAVDAAAVRAGVRPTPDSAGLLNRFYKFARFRGERSADRRSCRMVSLPQST